MPKPKKSYLELYRDPRWQKKRLEVMERDEFSCRSCSDKTESLHVHHCYYEDGKMPWEYETSSLVTLCEECHKSQKEMVKKHRSMLLKKLGQLGAFVEVETDSSLYTYLINLIECGEKIAGQTIASTPRLKDSGYDWSDSLLAAMEKQLLSSKKASR